MSIQRGLRSPVRRFVLPVLACALTFLVGCGGSTTGSDTIANQATRPSINSIQPDTGSPQGGTLVTIRGSGFELNVTGETQVKFHGAFATDVTVIDDTTITAVTPARTNLLLSNVKVLNDNGAAVLKSAFNFLSTAGILSDLNSDGFPDMVVSAAMENSNGTASGSVYVFYGSDDANANSDRGTSAADIRIDGNAEQDRLGGSVATGDVNGDGHTDLVIGAPLADSTAVDAGSVSIFLGPLPEAAQYMASEADIVLDGEGTVGGAWWGVTGDEFGAAISLGDQDGDGILDIVVSAPGADLNVDLPDEMEDAGRVYLFNGGTQLADGGAGSAAVIISGNRESDFFGTDVCLIDIDADGEGDLAASFDVFNSGPNHTSRVAIFDGQGLASGDVADADLVISAESDNDRFGAAIACGDVNADGSEDLLVGAPYTEGVGRSYVFLGGPGFSTTSATEADAIFFGQLTQGLFGDDLSSADVNGDGFADILVGAPFSSFATSWDGQVFVFYGAEEILDEVAFHGDVILTGEPISGERFGSAIEVLDRDADGIADVMSSATGHALASGSVHIFQGEESFIDSGASEDDVTLSGETEGANFGSSISRGK